MVADDIESAETGKLDELNQKHGSEVAVQGGYPTIYKIKKGGKVEYYNGERTVPKLVGWALQGVKQNKTIKRGGRKRTKTSKK